MQAFFKIPKVVLQHNVSHLLSLWLIQHPLLLNLLDNLLVCLKNIHWFNTHNLFLSCVLYFTEFENLRILSPLHIKCFSRIASKASPRSTRGSSRFSTPTRKSNEIWRIQWASALAWNTWQSRRCTARWPSCLRTRATYWPSSASSFLMPRATSTKRLYRNTRIPLRSPPASRTTGTPCWTGIVCRTSLATSRALWNAPLPTPATSTGKRHPSRSTSCPRPAGMWV